jgi:DNA-binding transcriptional ArsR family regulator
MMGLTSNGQGMIGDADIAASAAAIGDPSRARILLALLDGSVRPASELAELARVSRPTASSHLAKLTSAGFIVPQRNGRHCYYRLAGPEVAQVIEAISRIAPAGEIRSLRESSLAVGLRAARMCYDHLAGELGVSLTEALQGEGLLTHVDGSYELSDSGADRLTAFGLDLDELRRRRRKFSRSCLDWSERRDHVAGALGAGIATRVFELGWVKHHPSSRGLLLTDLGRRGFKAEFGITV